MTSAWCISTATLSAAHTAKDDQIQVTCTPDDGTGTGPPVTDTIATAAYRITQEALTNAVRHAGAGHVEVRVEAQNGDLLLTVADDGPGFNADDISEFEGLGLVGMKERAGLAGGILDIQSGSGSGTRISCRIPIDGRQTEAV